MPVRNGLSFGHIAKQELRSHCLDEDSSQQDEYWQLLIHRSLSTLCASLSMKMAALNSQHVILTLELAAESSQSPVFVASGEE